VITAISTPKTGIVNVLGPGFKYLNDAKKSLLKRKKRMLNDLSKNLTKTGSTDRAL